MAPDVLDFLLTDDAMRTGTAENAVITECFERKPERADVSQVQQNLDGEDVKLVITGSLRPGIGSSMHKMQLHSPCPSDNVSAYCDAIKHVNNGSFTLTWASAAIPARRIWYKKKSMKTRSNS